MNEIKTIVREITPELAKELLKRNHVNRKLNKRLIKFYAYQMRNNQWRLTGQGITIDRNGNLQDGQHRLNAVIEYGKGVEFLMIYGIDPDCNVNYDHGKTRSASDAMDILGIENNTRYSSQIRNYLIRKNTGINYLHGSLKGSRAAFETMISVQDIIDVYESNPKLWSEIATLTERCRKNLNIIPESIFGGLIAYLIIEKDYEFNKVKSFALQVHGIIPDEFEITRSLRKILMRDKLALKKLPPVTRSAYINKTWNYFIKGGKVQNLQFNSEIEKFPELI